MKMNKKTHGFTLIELMIVVAIIGILAGISIPQFANLVSKAQEGRTKANLGTLRSALSIYYGDTEGWYPVAAVNANLLALTIAGRYLQTVPNADLPKTSNNGGHPASSNEVSAASDGGGWVYNNGGQSNTSWGQILVNCSHQDLRTKIWTTY